MPSYQSGGAFLPEGDMNLKGAVNLGGTVTTSGATSVSILSATISGATITGGSVTTTGAVLTAPAISGAATIATGATITEASIVAPAISGAATVASGAILTTPTLRATVSTGTATGATGGAGLALTSVAPQYVAATGASGAGIDLPGGATGAVGLSYTIRNMMTGVLNVYAVGGTINGTTGTTAYAITATGNRTATIFSVAAGVWIAGGNT